MAVLFFDDKQQLIKIATDDSLISVTQEQELPQNGDLMNDTLRVDVLYHEELENAQFIAVKSHEGNAQTFDMYAVHSHQLPDNVLRFTGVNVGAHELSGYIVEDIRPANRTVSYVANQILRDTEWSVGYVDNNLPLITDTFYYMSAKDALKKLQTYGLEVVFKVEISGQGITDKWVEIYDQLGDEALKRFTYGSNALTVDREVSFGNIYTALIGRGKGEQVSDGADNPSGQAGYGRKINFEDVEWSIANGDPVDKPLGQNYVELPSATAEYGINTTNGKEPRMHVVEFNDEENPERLLELTYQHLVTIARPQVQFSASVVNIGDVNIGDTVTIHRHDKDIHYKTRVFKVTRDKLNNDRTSVKLGDMLVQSSTRRQQSINADITRLQDSQQQNAIDINYTMRTANGKNRLTYSNVEPEFKRTGDLWYRDHPSENGETQLLTWNGNAWEIILDSSDTTAIARRVNQALDEAQEAKDEALQSYHDSIDYTNQKVEEETNAWETEFNNQVDQINQDIGDVGARADEALADAGANSDLLDTHQSILDDINNVVLPDINSSISDIQQSVIPSIEQDISNVRTQAQQGINSALSSADTAWSHADSALSEAQRALYSFENLSIGGRNLAKGTSDNWESVSWSSWNVMKNKNIYVEPSQYYTISVDYKDVDTPNNVGVGLRLFWYDKDGTMDESRDSDNIADGEEGRINFTLKAPSNAYTVDIVLRQRERTPGGSAKYRNLKLEKGTVATDWTPAPEDVNSDIVQAWTRAELALDNVDSLDQSLQISIENINGELSRKAEQTLVDELAGTVSNHSTEISQTQNELSTKANQTVVDTLNETVANHDTAIVQNANKIASKASQSIVDNLSGTVSNHDTRITQNATDISSKADSSTVDTLNNTVENHTTEISQNATEIGLKADSSMVNQLTGEVEENSAQISINADEITRRLTSTEVNNLVEGKGYSTVNYVDNQLNTTAQGIYGTMEATQADFAEQISGISLQDKTEILSGTEIYTNKADDSVVHVEIDGKSYQDGEPTPDYPIEIHSVNDFDVVSSVGRENLLSNAVFSSSYVNTESFETEQWADTILSASMFEKSIKPNTTYTLSFDVELLAHPTGSNRFSRSVGLLLRDNNDVANTSVDVRTSNLLEIGDGESLSLTFTTPSIINNYTMYIYTQRNTEPVTFGRVRFENLRLVEGQENSPYSPAPEDITETDNHPLIDKINLLLSEPLRSVGDVKDRLFRDSDGLWKVERNVGELSITGSDITGYSTASPNLVIPDMADLGSGKNRNALTSHFESINHSYWNDPEGLGFHTRTTGTTFFFNYRGMSRSDFERWLDEQDASGNPVIIVYELKETTIETLDQKLQDKLNNLRSFQDSNYVYTVINDNLSERLKPKLHAVFKGGGWYEQFATDSRIRSLSNDFEVTAEEITQDLNAFKQDADGRFSNLNTRIETVAGEQTRQYKELTGELNNKLENSDLSGYATESYVNTEITEGINGVITRIESVESTQDSLSTSINNTKATADGNKNTIASIQNDPENTIVGYQKVTETADLYERVIGSSENEINNNVSRIIATSDVIQTEVSSMEFGGRNLLTGTSEEEQEVMTPNWSIGFWYPSLTIGEEYTFSFDIKSENATYLRQVFLNNSNSGFVPNHPISKEWTRVQFTFEWKGGEYNGREFAPHVYPRPDHSGTYVSRIKLEKGTIATDWTPAPEDNLAYTDSAVSTVQTQLDNSWAVQTLNSNSDVMAEIAITDSTARIKGKNILLDGNVSMTNAYITDLEALSINAVEGDITRLITDHLQADTITSKHMVSSLSMIDKLFATSALIDRLTSKSAFISDIQTIELTADKITTGTLNGSDVNIINLNVQNVIGLNAQFVQTQWNSIAGSVRVDGTGVRTTSANGNYTAMSNGSIFFRDHTGRSLGYMGVYADYSTSTYQDIFGIVVDENNSWILGEVRNGYVYSVLGYYDYLGANGVFAVNKPATFYSSLDVEGILSIGLNDESTIFTSADGYRLSLQGKESWELGSAGFVQLSGSRNVSQGRNYLSAYANLSMNGYNVTNTSDRRLKTNIDDYDANILDTFFRVINPVSFYWKDNERNQELQYGLIAQDTPLIANYDVAYDEWNINTSKQIMFNTFGVKATNERIDELEKTTSDRIAKLEREIKELKGAK